MFQCGHLQEVLQEPQAQLGALCISLTFYITKSTQTQNTIVMKKTKLLANEILQPVGMFNGVMWEVLWPHDSSCWRNCFQ